MELTLIARILNFIRKLYSQNKDKIHYSFYWLKNQRMTGSLLFIADCSQNVKESSIKEIKASLKDVKNISEGKNYLSFTSKLGYNYRISIFNSPESSFKITIDNLHLYFRGQEKLFRLFNEWNKFSSVVCNALPTFKNQNYILTIKIKEITNVDWSNLKRILEDEYSCEVVISKDVFKVKANQPIILQNFLNKFFVSSSLKQ